MSFNTTRKQNKRIFVVRRWPCRKEIIGEGGKDLASHSVREAVSERPNRNVSRQTPPNLLNTSANLHLPTVLGDGCDQQAPVNIENTTK